MKTKSRIALTAFSAFFVGAAAWAGCDDSHKASWASATETQPVTVADGPATQAEKPAVKEQREAVRKTVVRSSKKPVETAAKSNTELTAKELLVANTKP